MRIALATLLAVLSAGCASTQVVVKKVEGTAEPDGIRYSLPRPFLLVTPNTNGDGGFKAEVIYLADQSSTYAIHSRTRRGKYKVDVSVKDGLLSKIAWARTDAGVAAESVRVSGDLLKSELERVKSAQDEREKQNKADQEAAEKDLKTLRQDLLTKELDVALAEAEVASATEAVQQEKTPSARAALRDAELKLTHAKLKRDAAQRTLSERTGAIDSGTFNEPTTEGGQKPVTEAARTKFWGPVLYAIIDDGKGVALKAVQWDSSTSGLKQKAFDTAAAPKTPTPPADAPALKDTSERSFTWPQGSSTFTLSVPLTKAVSAVLSVQRQMFRKNQSGQPELSVPGPPFNVQADSAPPLLTITLTQPLAAGKYQLVVPFTWGEKQVGAFEIDIDVR